MRTRQILVLALGAALLALSFVFPYASYPAKEVSSDGLSFRSTARWGFVPIWKVWEANEKASLKGNVFDDAVIRWPVVIALAVGIFAFTGWYAYRLGH